MNHLKKEIILNTFTSLIKRQSLIAFFLLAYALSWVPSLTEAHSILPLGPFLAALIVLGLTSGKAGLLDFLRRIGRWRVGLLWYMLVLGLPVIVNLVATGFNVLLGAAMPTLDRVPLLTDFIPTLVLIFLFIGIGEEPAWRGFALPRLVTGRPILVGILLLWGLHVLWHLPLFGSEFDSKNGVPWALGLLGFTFITTWLYQQTDGNLLLPTLFHTAVNMTAMYMFNPFFAGADLIQMYWLWATLWLVSAFILYRFWPAKRGLMATEGIGQISQVSTART
jgi:membrane protease YdiL (CAAX protease family)